jgi:hypothetical protein
VSGRNPDDELEDWWRELDVEEKPRVSSTFGERPAVRRLRGDGVDLAPAPSSPAADTEVAEPEVPEGAPTASGPPKA